MQGISVLELVAAREFRPGEFAVGAGPELFQNVFLPRHNYFGRGLLLSAILHCMVIFGAPPLVSLIPESDAQALQRQMLAMRALEIRIPERLYLPALPAKPPAAAEPPKPKQSRPPLELAKKELPEEALSQAVPAPRVALRDFKPPPELPRVNDDQTLIQAHLPPSLALQQRVRLPQLVLNSAPVLQRPAPRTFVEPGRSAAAAIVPRFETPPQLAAPAMVDNGLRIPSMLAGPDDAVLRLPAPTEAARAFQAPAPIPSGRGASVSPQLGEQISVVALSEAPALLQERLVIPVGNQLGRLPDLPPAPATAESAGGRGDLASAMTALPARYATPIRMEHPVNATFDVVVQSSSDEVVPESVGALSGQPVYTAYVEAGSPKAWILQYCVPRETQNVTQPEAGVVNIGGAAPLRAPFPIITVLPPVTMVPRTAYIIVHGFVDASGQIRDARVLRAPSDSYKTPLLADLGKWQFRPAVRSGKPITVEVLLAIPPQKL
jgi:hypothetical protein